MKMKFVFKDGKVYVDVLNARGKQCIEVTDRILEVLNAELKNRWLKPEYYWGEVVNREHEYSEDF